MGRRNEFYIGALNEVSVELTKEGKINWDHLARELRPYEDGNWVATTKVDGMWVCARMNRPKTTNEIVSRNSKPKTDESVNGLLGVEIPQQGALLVGELLAATEWATQEYERLGHRQIYLFDVAEEGCSGSRLYQTMGWWDRYQKLREWYDGWSEDAKTRMPVVSAWEKGFLEKFKEEIEMKRYGGEGIMLWRKDLKINGKIRADGKVRGLCKGKGLKDKSYILVGTARTTIGNVLTCRWGLYDGSGKLRDVMQAGCPNIKSEVDAKRYMGRVADFVGFTIFRSGSMRSAQFQNWRDDVSLDSCVVGNK